MHCQVSPTTNQLTKYQPTHHAIPTKRKSRDKMCAYVTVMFWPEPNLNIF